VAAVTLAVLAAPLMLALTLLLLFAVSSRSIGPAAGLGAGWGGGGPGGGTVGPASPGSIAVVGQAGSAPSPLTVPPVPAPSVLPLVGASSSTLILLASLPPFQVFLPFLPPPETVLSSSEIGDKRFAGSGTRAPFPPLLWGLAIGRLRTRSSFWMRILMP
jgi:hypothetical protein